MKVKNLLNRSILSLAVISGLTAMAQETRKIQPCNTYAAMEEAFAKDPAARARYEAAQTQMYKEYLDYSDKRNANKTAAVPVYTVPVVFHILHQGGVENISDNTIINALAYVNKDYARTNTDANSTDPPFNTSYIDSEIKFMLAKKDPNGNCTSGIVRHIDDRTDWKQANVLTNYAYTWDPTKYLNVYIVKNIVPTSTVTGGGIIVGYTYKPATWPTSASQDAIVYRYDFLTNGDDPRSLSHEIGHWLNLSHTWGNTNNPGVACGDDGIGDTPETMGEFSTCPSTSVNTCVQTNTVYNGLNNVENIMNYSNCPKNFTTGQTNAMRAAIISSASGRNNLWTAGNLTFTDINGTTPCAPVADFMSTAAGEYTVCAGQTIVNFKDYSYNGTVTSWTWTASNSATIASPNAAITSIYFPTIGTSIVTLSVTNGVGVGSISKNVTVLNGAVTATTGNFESFEGSGTPDNWTVQNPGGVGWAQTSLAARHGVFSFMLDGGVNTSLAEDILVMPVMDFANNPGATLRFSYAYRQKSSTHLDIFRVQLSDNCGASWKDVWAPSASGMASGSGGVGTTNFIPTASQWKAQDVSNHPNYFSFSGSTSVMARFYFQEANGGFGGKMYIDSVALVAAPLGVTELTKHLRLSLYPNPTNSSSSLNFVLSNDAKVKVSVMDIAGKLVSPEMAYTLGAGDHKIILNENGTLNKGIYIVSLDYNGTKMARKLIIE